VAINSDQLIDFILDEHSVKVTGKATINIDGKSYRSNVFQKFLTNKYLADRNSDLLALDDSEKKIQIAFIADRILDWHHARIEEFNRIPTDSILSGLEEVDDFMNYRPVMDVASGETYMFCIRTEMIAEMDFSAWLSIAPKAAKEVKTVPCISIYDPTDNKKCYAGTYHPTSKAEIDLKVLYINEHIKPEWRN
tara:strand:- start:2288 stop:2866 length:579 start_codon:yes stop_codon:yes gene_type:complete